MKKLLSVLLSIVIILGTLVPSLVMFAEGSDDEISVLAESSENITINKSEESIEEDFDGSLSLSAGYYDIERDYSQSCDIVVKNVTENTLEYYLSVQNPYDDLYMNFVRNGSVDKPMIIAAGEEQHVQLDVFAQNAKHGDYTLPIFAYTVSGEKSENCAKTTAYLSCPVVSLNVTLTKEKENESTLAQTYALTNCGDYLTDVAVNLEGEAGNYVALNPILSTEPMSHNQKITFTATPDLTKMKNSGVSSLSGELVVSSGGSEKRFPVVFDTKGQEIITSTIGEIVEYQFSKNGDKLSTKGKHKDSGAIETDSGGPQCTNAGKVSVNTYLPSVNGNDALFTSATDENNSKIRVFLTSRMYGGGYVDREDTNYDYYINGVKTIRSKNTGLTEVSIVELPTENLKFGAMNTIVRDYDTNPGSHFVTASTEITVVYPGDTPISYIGSPESIPDIRCLPDYAVYSENIFSDTNDMIIGKSGKVGCNIYNRGSADGTFDIIVEDENGVIYTEKDHKLSAFSGDKVVFDWTPKKASTKITVKLINTEEDIEDKNTSNNEATATITARTRTAPTISGINPDYTVVGEGIVSADILNAQDVTKTDFYIDNKLYTGEVKTSVNGTKMTCWINDTELSKGKHSVRIVATYFTSSETTSECELSDTIYVFEKNWNKYTLEFDESVNNVQFYLYNNKNNSYKSIYTQQLSDTEYQYTIDKQMYDALEDYCFFATLEDGFVYKQANDANKIMLSSRNTMTLKYPDQFSIESLKVRKFNDKNIYANLSVCDELSFTPGKYEISIEAYWLGEYNNFNFEVDLTDNDCVVDLSQFIPNYRFSFADAVSGTPSATMYYKNAGDESWSIFDLAYEYENGVLTCLVPSYNRNIFAYAEKAFVCVTTDDSVFTLDVDKNSNNSSKIISLDKATQQKYTVSANNNDADFEIYEVSVSCDRFSVSLYANVIYLPAGEYDIVAYCKENEELFETSALSDDNLITYANYSEKNKVSINWNDGFLDKDAFINFTNSDGKTLNVSGCKNGEKIELEKSKYTVETNLIRNDSKYTVLSKIDTLLNDAEISIDNCFNGIITNSFDSVAGNSSIRLFFDKLVDKNGNELISFNSQNDDDNLNGNIILTDISTGTKYYIPVTLNSVSYADVKLPNVDGTFSVKLEVKTGNELYRPVDGISFDKNEITIKCGKEYQLEANVLPENATNKNLIWSSSNEKVAKVDANGLVKAGLIKSGSTIITATTEDGSFSAQCKVNVKLAWWQYLILTLFGSAILAAIIALI